MCYFMKQNVAFCNEVSVKMSGLHDGHLFVAVC